MGKKLKITLKDALCSLRLLLLPWRVYDVYIGNPKHDSYEDPKCPSSWRDSGCYDIDLYGWDYERFRICARSESEACRLYEAWSEKTYNDVLAENMRKAVDYWDERRAMEKAKDESNREGTLLGVMPGSFDEGDLEHGEVEYVEWAEGEWSHQETEVELEDAVYAFGYTY